MVARVALVKVRVGGERGFQSIAQAVSVLEVKGRVPPVTQAKLCLDSHTLFPGYFSLRAERACSQARGILESQIARFPPLSQRKLTTAHSLGVSNRTFGN